VSSVFLGVEERGKVDPHGMDFCIHCMCLCLKVLKEEEESIRVDLHEGCGRVKFYWLLALADAKTLKAVVEFRAQVSDQHPAINSASSPAGCAAGDTCRSLMLECFLKLVLCLLLSVFSLL